MTLAPSTEKKIMPQQKGMLLLCLFALISFALSFYWQYSINAEISGSWKYIVNARDDFWYWAQTKGAADEPNSEGNPFYYEEKGTRHTLSEPMMSFFGFLTKILGVNVLFFFPIWHIGMPFISWLALSYCLRRYWKHPPISSGIFALIFILSIRLLPNTGFMDFHRYVRPGDALWILMLAISFVVTMGSGHYREYIKKNLHAFVIGTTACLALIWFNLLFFCLLAMVLGMELIWHAFAARDKERLKTLGIVAGMIGVSALAYYLFLRMNMHNNPWVFKLLSHESSKVQKAGIFRLGWKGFDFAAISLFTVMTALIIVTRRVLGRPLSPMDRILFSMLVVRLAVNNVHMFVPGKFQIASHAYYFIPIEFLCLIGWLHEKIPFY